MPAKRDIPVDKIRDLYKTGKSIREIAAELNCGHSLIRKRMCKYKIKRRNKSDAAAIGGLKRDYWGYKNPNWRGGRNKAERKLRLLKLMGGKCVMCGLEATIENEIVFDFHHIDKRNKKLVSKMILCPKTSIDEIKKCVVSCANCHRIEHWTAKRRGEPKFLNLILDIAT